MRYVDNDEYIPVLKEIIESGRKVSMVVSGNSMRPLITHQKDSVQLEAPDRPLKKGDIVFYQRVNGQYVLHRICRIDREGHIWCIGDAQTVVEGPLDQDCVFAIVTGIHRKGKWYYPRDFVWKFFEYVWIRMIPIRPYAVSFYGFLCRFRPKK